MNPCPCGEGGSSGRCRCSDHARARYMRRLSEPLLDRFDLRIEVQPPEPLLLMGDSAEETTEEVGRRVSMARDLALERGVACNAQIPADRLDEVCALDSSARDLLKACLIEGHLTGRGLRRVRLLARTVADLKGELGPLTSDAIDVALGLRTPLVTLLGRDDAPGREPPVLLPGRTR